MKKIVSFKKDLLFKTKVSEITSISLEHKILTKDDDLVSGEFLINGEYKMTEGSINREIYNFILPFDIALNSKYDVDTVKIDIDNFYYEVLNNDILNVNIDLLIEAKEKELVRSVVEEIKPLENLNVEMETSEIQQERPNFMENIKIENELEDDNKVDKITNNIIKKNKDAEENINNTNINIFNVDNGETYSTYYVYIVKEDDTIDKILDKYIENIKPLDKLIIPTNGR